MKGLKPLITTLFLANTALSIFAQDEGLIEPEPVDFKKPFVYSLSGMAVGLPLLIGTGAFNEGPSMNNFQDAYERGPVWDHDSAVFNYCLHPLWGSETYLRAREANFGLPGSIAFSMGMSVTWEYLFESWVEHPSAQDLIFTTGIGWVIGEARYQLKNRSHENWHWVIDPINTTLEHVTVRFHRTPDDEVATVFAYSQSF